MVQIIFIATLNTPHPPPSIIRNATRARPPSCVRRNCAHRPPRVGCGSSNRTWKNRALSSLLSLLPTTVCARRGHRAGAPRRNFRAGVRRRCAGAWCGGVQFPVAGCVRIVFCVPPRPLSEERVRSLSLPSSLSPLPSSLSPCSPLSPLSPPSGSFHYPLPLPPSLPRSLRLSSLPLAPSPLPLFCCPLLPSLAAPPIARPRRLANAIPPRPHTRSCAPQSTPFPLPGSVGQLTGSGCFPRVVESAGTWKSSARWAAAATPLHASPPRPRAHAHAICAAAQRWRQQ